MKFNVTLARLRIEVAEVEIDVKVRGADPEAGRATAIMMAKLQVPTLDEAEWQDATELTPHDYEPWAIEAVSNAEAREEGMTLMEHVMSSNPDRDKRYILLEADTDDVTGRLITQPWFSRDDLGLVEHDIAKDWAGELKGLIGDGLDEDDFPIKPKQDGKD